MPMGTTHRTINTFASIPFTGAVYIALHRSPLESLCFFAGYTFATFFMNPDLDLVSDGYQSWGFFRFYWWPYQKALAHRSFLSHFPIISTIGRIIYLLWLPVLLIFLLGSSIQSLARDTFYDWIPEFAPYLLFLVLGMMCSDTLHLFLDLSSTKLKRTFGGKGGRKRRESFLEHHGETSRRSRGYRDDPSWRRRGFRGTSRSRR
jgi:uncharacterized metal-binding protein